MRTVVRVAVSCAAVVGAMWMATGAAQAASLVYVKDGNVWLANADGSGQYQVTTDGSSSQPYRSPSQADDGTILALRSGRLWRMRQNGTLLNEPIATAASGSGPLTTAISPNGALTVFDYITTTRPGFTQEAIYTHSDRLTQRDEIDPAGYGFNDPSWIDDGRTMLFIGTRVWTEPVGPGDETLWFNDQDTTGQDENLYDGETAGAAIALIRGEPVQSLQFYRRNGGDFDADPTPVCSFTEPTGEFNDPTLTPAGNVVAWQEGDGIWTSAFPGQDCAGAEPRLTIAGGSEPDFGPAAVNPGPRPTVVAPKPCCTPPVTKTPPALTVSVKKRIRRAALIRKGLRVRFGCSRTCAVIAELRVAKRIARRYKLPRKLGRGAGATSGATKTLVVKLGKKAKRQLRKARPRRLKLTLVLSVGDGSGPIGTTRRTIVVRR